MRVTDSVHVEIAEEAATDPLYASLRFSRGRVARARGDDEEARAHFEDALDLWSRCGAPFEAAQARANLGSILSVIAIPGRAPYASSKAGIANLSRVLALEWADRGVTVNALCPGPFGTEMNRPLMNDPEKYKAFVAKIPMGRWGELHEIAGAVVFLASDAASYVTGSALFVDGGWTAQ